MLRRFRSRPARYALLLVLFLLGLVRSQRAPVALAATPDQAGEWGTVLNWASKASTWC